MTIVLFWSVALAVHAGSTKVPAILVTFIASVLIWERPISDGYWIVIGLSVLSYWSISINKNTELPKSLI